MNKALKIIFVLALASGFTFQLEGQKLVRLSENPVIKKYRAEHKFKGRDLREMSLLTLPFFEDFSTSDTVPDPLKWVGQSVFINNSFGKDPISIGVATFDAIDDKGDVYATYDKLTSSDTLTSQPIDLALYASGTDTVRLSFYYQAGGNGEVPEMKDTFLLEFKRMDGKWQEIWKVNKDSVTPFEQVILDVDKSFYYSGFQFRFRNYTSTSVNEVTGGPGALGNADIWNLDYIMMDTKTKSEHQYPGDLTMVYPPFYLLNTYEIVPWTHLNAAQILTHNYLRYVIRNLYSDPAGKNVKWGYYVRDLQLDTTSYFQQYNKTIGPITPFRIQDTVYFQFIHTGNSVEGKIQVAGYLYDTPTGNYKNNDTAKTMLDFKDYYAYDDGTPEYGFGISGESTADAFMAYRFRIFMQDTLRAVDMYFNKTRDNYNSTEGFQLCVWKFDPTNPGKPGDLVYISPEVFSPDASAGFLDFTRYYIDPGTTLVISDSIVYVGWKQQSSDYLNVGYDDHRDTRSKIFINISGSWFNPGNSILPGSLMVRPVFGKKPVISGERNLIEPTQQILLAPNPANNILTITHNSLFIRSVVIYDIFGRQLYHSAPNIDNIDVSSFPSGLYLVTVTCTNGMAVRKKIVISH